DSDPSGSTVEDVDEGDDDYVPDIIAGVGYVTDPFKARLVGAYDSSMEEGAIKLRLDGTIGDLSVFAMGGWNTDGDRVNNYAQWDGEWAAWIGASYVLTEKATINASMNFDEGGDIEGALNIAYAVVPGFEIIPELDFRNKMDEKAGPDAEDWGGVIRFQRNF
ncbi:MAG TPA: porin, partial [Mycoplana sp.]|nr:porin [Mycoplana sp.]